MKKIISIDTGNKMIKSVGFCFPAGLVESKYLPSIGGDVLNYEGKTYTVVDQNFPVLNDKSENDRYFLLSLIAIGKELADEAEIMRKLTPNDHIKIELLIGLPLLHHEVYKARFSQYFTKRAGVIKFELNGKPFAIRITGATVYPQAYAAAITAFEKLKGSNIANIVDVGGFTVDCLQLENFRPNMMLCTSLYQGINKLIQSINDQMRGAGGREIANNVIEGILRKDSSYLAEYSTNRIDTITFAAQSHTEHLLAEIEQNFDLEEDKTVFMGGGSVLLKEYILQTGKVKKPVFIDDIHANAIGYQQLYAKKNSGASYQLHSA